VLGRRSAEEIKDIGQCLVEAHRLAVEAGVQGLTLPEGGFLFLAEADVAETIKVPGYWETCLKLVNASASAVLPNQISPSGTQMIPPWSKRRVRW
jgi:hypothetical protein